jgi:hypothetical protein
MFRYCLGMFIISIKNSEIMMDNIIFIIIIIIIFFFFNTKIDVLRKGDQ